MSTLLARPIVHVMIAAAFAGAAVSAHATLITFEGASGFQNVDGGSLDVGDYRFTLTAVLNSFEFITDDPQFVETDTTKLFSANHSVITMSRVDGGAFRLDSFDLGGSWVDPQSWVRWADTVTAANGSENVLGDLGAHAAATYLSITTGFSDFTTSVTFRPTVNAGTPGPSGINNFEFTLDNISITDRNDVPEPGSLALLGLGALALGCRRRRRR